MYCEKCNIDFQEGLRYCKWCGQTLIERQRVTSELYSCPACAASVQPAWAFCKACGAKLDALQGAAAPSEPLRQVSTEAVTEVFIQCRSCGESVEAAAMYCKACGSAVYDTPDPLGASSLLCSVCNSYSPVGSAACRVCGTAFQAARPAADSPARATLSDAQEKPSTLPDLPGHLSSLREQDHVGGTVEMASYPASAPAPADKTAIFSSTEAADTADSTTVLSSGSPDAGVSGASHPPASSFTKSGAETSVLPGVAGSEMEQQAPTSLIGKGRDTSPVESAESTELNPDTAIQAPVRTSPVTRIDATVEPKAVGPAAADRNQSAPLGGDRTVELSSNVELRASWQAGEDRQTGEDLQPPEDWQPPSQAGGTVIMGSVAAPEPPAEREPRANDAQQSFSTRYDVTAPFALNQPPAGFDAGQTEVLDSAPASVAPPADASAPLDAMKMTRDISTPHAPPPPTGGLGAQPDAPQEWQQPAAITVQPDAQPAAVAQAPAKQKSMAGIISVLVGVVIVAAAGFVIWWFVIGGKRTEPAPPPAAQETPTAPAATAPAQPAQPAAPVAPEGMVLVPAGSYVVGVNGDDPLEMPQHTVELRAFFIDRTEVTNADYKKFVDATNRKAPDGWAGGSYPQGQDRWPVTGVTWQDAVDYAAWAGKRLPTEAEWEAAARGSDGRLYPWGNQYRSGVANIETKSIGPVGQFAAGASPAGALDMIGNVWEWTADEFKLYPGSTASMPPVETGKTYRVFRGGAYDGDKRHDAAYRGFDDGDKPYPKIGFRCAKDAR